MPTSKTKAAQPDGRGLGGELRRQLKALLDGGQAHATFDQAVKDMPAKLQGVVPEGTPYSAWQLLEHIRLAQRDILDFSRNEDGSYRELKWPDEYWPKDPEPPNAHAWNKSIEQIREEHLLRVDSHGSGFDLGQIQDIADQVEQVGARALYGAREFHLLTRQVAVRVLRKLLPQDQDAVERRAQLM